MPTEELREARKPLIELTEWMSVSLGPPSKVCYDSVNSSDLILSLLINNPWKFISMTQGIPSGNFISNLKGLSLLGEGPKSITVDFPVSTRGHSHPLLCCLKSLWSWQAGLAASHQVLPVVPASYPSRTGKNQDIRIAMEKTVAFIYNSRCPNMFERCVLGWEGGSNRKIFVVQV